MSIYLRNRRIAQVHSSDPDAHLCRLTNELMERDDSINNVDITISVKEGTTTLTGTAGSFRAKWSAGAAAHRAGAKKVRNEILVVSF